MLMLSTVAFELFKKVFYSKGFLLVIVGGILALFLNGKVEGISDTISGWFGKKSVPELKAEIAIKDESLAKLNQLNEEKDKQREMQEKINDSVVDSIVTINIKDKSLDEAVSKSKTKKKEKIEEISVSDISDEEKVVLESIAVLDSIVEVYCEVEPNCKERVTS